MTSLKKLSIAVAIACAGTATLAADVYPAKPVRVVVTTVPGPLDAFARAVLQEMQARLKQPFVVDNRPGAGGNVGSDMVAKAPADGYTLLFALDTTFTVNPSLYEKMPFDPAKDFRIIGVPVTYSQMLGVGPSIQVDSLPDFVKLARAKNLSYASGGNGSPSHLTMAAFLASAGLDLVHGPYKGTGASVVDVIGGQVDSLFAVTSGILPQVKAGKLKALAISGPQRSVAAPDVPTVAEQGYPGFNASFAYVLAAPAGTPDSVVQLLARELDEAMKTPRVAELNRIADYQPIHKTLGAAADWLSTTRASWSGVITKARITAN